MKTSQNKPATFTHQYSRRRFLQTAATATVLTAFGAPFISRAWAAEGAKSPFKNLVPRTRKVRVAGVGVGGKGYSDIIGAVDAGAEVVALCDVDFARGSRSFYAHPGAARYRDYRQMLEEMDAKIDAVIIATPDHMHFPVAMMAMQRGKHIYVQKPLTHTIGEARALKAASRKYGVVTQMGNQGHANDATRATKEWIEAGVIGQVREVQSWTDRPIWPQAVSWPTPGADQKSPPDTLDWNLWLGVAPYREFLPNIAPGNWRGFWDYGCGALGDMGCHIMDAPFWALNLTGNCKLTANSEGNTPVSGPKASTITYEFPARGSFAPMRFVWNDGGRLPAAPKEIGDEKLPKNGTIYYGDKGIFYSPGAYGSPIKLIPDEKMKAFTNRPSKTIPRPPKADPYLEWINAIQGGVAPGSNIADYSADLTEFVSLGNLALRTGKTIRWDAVRGECTGLPEVQILINKNYRVY